jgi:hypothetical protein
VSSRRRRSAERAAPRGSGLSAARVHVQWDAERAQC